MLDSATLFLNQAETSPHVHFIYDLHAQRVVFINDAYESLLQGHRKQVNEELPALLARLHPDDLPLLHHYWKMWQKGTLQDEVEIHLYHLDSPDQWLCLTPNYHQDEAGQVYLSGSLRDITVTKLYKQNSDEFNIKKNTTLEILSHDLAGAFIMLQQLTEYVQQEMGESANAKVPEMLNMMQQTCQKSVVMIHDLVDQEFLASTTIPLKRERVDLREQVQHCLEPFRRAPGNEGRQLLCELSTEPLYVDIDVNKLLQVVSNLVHNALKFTPDEGRILVKAEPCPSCVRITIADEGIGIPAALQPQVFERFTPARRPGLRGEPTTGLGLSLCKTIVMLHQGTLTMISTEGKGTTFTIELPAFADREGQK